MASKFQEIANRFHQLFLGLDRVYGKFTIGAANPDKAGKLEGEAATIVGQVTPALWEKQLEGKQGLGLVPITDAATCNWGAIDIDEYNIDHKALEKKIEKMPLVLCRTKSGGAHLYLFCKEPIAAEVVRGKLLDLAMQLGHSKVEVFPKQTKLWSKKDPGSWINMPYFDCNGSNLRYGIYQGQPLTPEQFLTYAENKKVARADLEQATLDASGGEDFADGPPCLQILAKEGIPEGGRNNGLYNFGVYAKMKYPDGWEDKLEEYNHQFLTPPLKMADLKLLIKSLKKKVYYYQCSQPPINGHCNKEICKGRQHGIGGDEPDVEYTGLIKINSQPPTWILEVNGARLELTTADMLQQQKVRLKCLDALNILPKSISPVKYEKVIKTLLENVTVVEAPPDAGPEGRLWDLIERFFAERAGGKSIEDLLRALPFTEKGLTKFRSQDLMKYLDTQHFRDLNERQIWAIFRRDEKVLHGQSNVKGTLVRWWAIPEIKRQDSDFNIPKVKEEM